MENTGKFPTVITKYDLMIRIYCNMTLKFLVLHIACRFNLVETLDKSRSLFADRQFCMCM